MSSQRSDNEWIALISTLLTAPKIPDDLCMDPGLAENPNFQKLYGYINDLRALSAALAHGDLQMFAYTKGYILSNMKALQANLRHLTWQTKQVAEGDFSQRAEFLGEFSDSFNEMTIKLHQNQLELERLANVDFLTQIPNRRSAMQFLEQLFLLYKRSFRAFSIMSIDIDNFKNVNDTYGHDVGDRVLKHVSSTLKDVFRASDVFCRIGGEEFLAVLPETGLAGAVCIAERIRTVLEKSELEIEMGPPLKQTISIGVSQVLPGDDKYNDVIIRSDNALYMAKENGRNRVYTNPYEDVDELLKSMFPSDGDDKRSRNGTQEM
ncbi:MAG: GGDEF domain-containing protein [Clostridiales Family XIII bacterium]|jgi:diguanylate cyclase (GGDEF)-like protein|nr:GGDEF domain-containing protein [Clostridiales Family XIII bacterium]